MYQNPSDEQGNKDVKLGMIIGLIIALLLISPVIAVQEHIKEEPKFTAYKEDKYLKFEVKEDIYAHELIKEAVEIRKEEAKK